MYFTVLDVIRLEKSNVARTVVPGVEEAGLMVRTGVMWRAAVTTVILSVQGAGG